MATILNLSPRLETIIDLCDHVKTIADIGCDHGYVTAELVLEEKAQKVIASDKSASCLNKAVLLCDSMNINNFISFREGNGFEVITKRDKVNLAIIAGMGGKEIISILEKRPKKLYNFIFQPQSDIVLLRQYLINNGFEFVVDKLVKDANRYYNVIKVQKCKKPREYNNLEVYFGVTNFRENYQLFYEYLVERYLFLQKFKVKYGELNKKNEEEWYFVNEAIKLFGVDASTLTANDTQSQEDEQKLEESTDKGNENTFSDAQDGININ